MDSAVLYSVEIVSMSNAKYQNNDEQTILSQHNPKNSCTSLGRLELCKEIHVTLVERNNVMQRYGYAIVNCIPVHNVNHVSSRTLFSA